VSYPKGGKELRQERKGEAGVSDENKGGDTAKRSVQNSPDEEAGGIDNLWEGKKAEEGNIWGQLKFADKN